MTNSREYDKRLITKCVVAINDAAYDDIFPCQAWQVSHYSTQYINYIESLKMYFLYIALNEP